MTTEVAPFGADPARNVRATVSQASVERAFAILLAVFAFGFGAVNTQAVIKQLPALDPVMGIVVPVVLAASFVFVACRCSSGGWSNRRKSPPRCCSWLCSSRGRSSSKGRCTANSPGRGTSATSARLRQPWASPRGARSSTTAVVPVVYALVRLTPPGGDVSVLRAVLDGGLIGILGGAALVLIVVLRRTAAAVDTAQATAVRGTRMPSESTRRRSSASRSTRSCTTVSSRHCCRRRGPTARTPGPWPPGWPGTRSITWRLPRTRRGTPSGVHDRAARPGSRSPSPDSPHP